jgi:3-keto-5-aminohexanoate cleavage enzyme
MGVEERIAALELRPDMATLTLGTCNFGDEIFENSLPTIRAILERLRTFGITPELEIFDVGMLSTADVLFAKGLLTPPAHFDFVLGVPGAAAATAENLVHFARAIPAGSTWTVAGIGRRQTAMATLAIAMGGHVRVGFEDNIFYRKGELADSNARFVERVVRIAREVGREPATIAEARRILRLPAAA